MKRSPRNRIVDDIQYHGFEDSSYNFILSLFAFLFHLPLLTFNQFDGFTLAIKIKENFILFFLNKFIWGDVSCGWCFFLIVYKSDFC